jgi:hypothetical protein
MVSSRLIDETDDSSFSRLRMAIGSVMELSSELDLDFFCRSDGLAGGRGFEDIHVLRMEARHHCEYASLMEKKVQLQRQRG